MLGAWNQREAFPKWQEHSYTLMVMETSQAEESSQVGGGVWSKQVRGIVHSTIFPRAACCSPSLQSVHTFHTQPHPSEASIKEVLGWNTLPP